MDPEAPIMGIPERLIKHGFYDTVVVSKKKIKKVARQEKAELFQHNTNTSEWPQPLTRYRMMLEYPDLNIEQMYFWILRHYQEMWGCNRTEKVIDTMASSVASSTFGNLQTRLSAQQNQAAQFLKGVSEMVKGLFQIVREIRVLDDRLSYYKDTFTQDKELAQSSEIVLKGLWVDQVEGGSKNPTSVYGLASTVGFTILPDVFFRLQLKDKRDIEKVVTALKFNEKVKEVLRRKLRQYYEWKERTHKELDQRRRFMVKYLRQHYSTIQLYMSWISPYLRYIRRLQMSEKRMKNENLINAFETQIIEIETLFVREDENFAPKKGVISCHFFYRVKPELSYHSYEYQHKGPIYAGQADLTIRAYAWTDKELQGYLDYRKEEELELMGEVDKSIQDALDSLGDELKDYLREAGEHFPGDPEPLTEEQKKELAKKKPKFPSIFDPFTAPFKSLFPKKDKNATPKKKKAKKKKISIPEENRKAAAAHFAKEAARTGWQKYKEGPGECVYFVPDV